jgi:hypothetical protein
VPFVIDDTAAAVGMLTEAGRHILEPAVSHVRNSILLFAATRRWPIITHSDYVEWVAGQLDPDYVWLVLDPLMPLPKAPVQAYPLRMSRKLEGRSWVFDVALPADVQCAVSQSEVGVLDDAVSSGATVLELNRLLQAVGAGVVDVISAIASGEGIKRLRATLPEVSIARFATEFGEGIHLRDACPFLPFSGRRVLGRTVDLSNGTALDCAYPAAQFRGAVWPILRQDPAVRHAMWSSYSTVLDRARAALGRPATVADIPLLGADISLPLVNRPIQASDRLATLVPAM